MIQPVNIQVKNIYRHVSSYLPSIELLKTTAKTTALVALIIASIAIISTFVLDVAVRIFFPIIGLKGILTDRNLLDEFVKDYQNYKGLNI